MLTDGISVVEECRLFKVAKLVLAFVVPGTALAVGGVMELASGDKNEFGWTFIRLGLFSIAVGSLIGYKVGKILIARQRNSAKLGALEPSHANRCVYVAENMIVAADTAAWLNDNGIATQMIDPGMMGDVSLGRSIPISTRGIEIWVDDPNQMSKALELIGQHELLLAEDAEIQKNKHSVKVRCEKCSAESDFPGEQCGTVQCCPHCSAYLDVEEIDVGA